MSCRSKGPYSVVSPPSISSETLSSGCGTSPDPESPGSASSIKGHSIFPSSQFHWALRRERTSAPSTASSVISATTIWWEIGWPYSSIVRVALPCTSMRWSPTVLSVRVNGSNSGRCSGGILSQVLVLITEHIAPVSYRAVRSCPKTRAGT